MRNTLVRLLIEAAFIILVLVIARLADLSAGWIILCGAVAWLLTAIAEGYVSRGWQGAATFVPPVRPFATPRAPREPAPVWETTVTPPEQVAPAWLETAEVLGVHVSGFEAPPPEPAEPEPAEPIPAEPEALEPVEVVEPAAEEPVAEEPSPELEEAAEEEEPAVSADAEVPAREDLAVVAEGVEAEAAVSGETAPEEEQISPPAPVQKPIRSRLPRRFVTQSGRPRPAQPPIVASVDEPPPAAEEPMGAAEPEPPEAKPWPPPDRRWPWRRTRGEQEPDRGPAPERREGQPELPLFEVPERLCRSCGQPISKERLRAIPNATQCIDCKRAGRPELADIPDFELASETEAELPAPETVEDVVVEREPVAIAAEPEPEPEPDLEADLAPDLTPDLAPEPAAVSAEAAPEPPVEPAAPVAPSAFPDSAREWNVWELERLARRLGGRDAARDEEWAFLLVYLREFANPEGSLPADFDALVRESFPELIAVAETS